MEKEGEQRNKKKPAIKPKKVTPATTTQCDNNKNITKDTITPRGKSGIKVPPFILKEKERFTSLLKHQMDRKMNYRHPRAVAEGLQMNPLTKEDIISHPHSNHIACHTFQTEEEKTLRVVIKGITESISTDQVKTNSRN